MNVPRANESMRSLPTCDMPPFNLPGANPFWLLVKSPNAD